MSKFWVICKHEYLQIVKKKSFIVGILLTPVLMAAFMVVPAWLATKDTSSAEYLTIVDQSGMGLGEKFSEELNRYKLDDGDSLAYKTHRLISVDPDDVTTFAAYEDSVRNSITNKSYRYGLMIKPNPLSSEDSIYIISNSDNMIAYSRFERCMTDVVSVMRVEQAALGLSVDSVLALTSHVDIPIRDTKGEAIPFIAKFITATIFVMMIYMLIIINGTMLMRSVVDEKNSRIMEVLVSSASPFQMMLGKVLGFGAAAFTQVGVWVLMGAVLMVGSGAMALEIDPAISRLVFNPVIVIFFVLLFIVGYILYSTFFALIGSIVNSDKETQSFIFPVAMCLIMPVMLGSAIARDPNAVWVTVLSLIPFFAPTMMMMRIMFIAPSMTEYPLFSGIVLEATLAFLITAATTVFVIWLAAKVFRIGILMYGKRPTLPEIIKWIRY